MKTFLNTIKAVLAILYFLLVAAIVGGAVFGVLKALQSTMLPGLAIFTVIVPITAVVVLFVFFLCAYLFYAQHGRRRPALIHTSAALFIIVIGLVFTRFLISRKKEPARVESKPVAPLLEAQRVNAQDITVVVDGYGTVKAKNMLKIVPQVPGRIIDLHPNFVNGGFFKKGEMFVTIDKRDYENAVQRAEAAVASAQVKLQREQAEAEVARREWQQLHPNEEPTSPLVLREPQIAEAKASLKAAQAELENAKLNLERTTIYALFNGRVLEESIDVGQYYPAGQIAATVYGTDEVEITIPLEDSQLQWFNVPLAGQSDTAGSSAIVKAEFAGSTHTWKGRVVRTEGQIDPRSRMVHVVVQVDQPFEKVNGRPPLQPGMFVNVEIIGSQLKNVIPIPRTALHNGSHVWVANNSHLHIKDVDIARLDKENAYISAGIDSGAIVITDSLEAVAENMRIRPRLTENSEDKENQQ